MTETNKNQKVSTGASFGKIMIASAVGIIIVSIVMSILSLMFFASIANSKSKTSETPKNSVLQIKLNYPIVEQQQDDFYPNLDFLSGFANSKSLGLNKIKAALKNAKTDENIKGIFLEVSAPMAGLAELKEIRDAILDFKKSGKFIIAHSNLYSPGAYYLATAADKIYITPTGMLIWKGFSAQVMYYKDLLKKLEITPEIVRHGKFKSAVEPYLLDSMSNENRVQLQAYIDNVWKHYVAEIAEARDLDISSLNNYADKLTINSTKKAVSLGFIDAEKFRNDVVDEISGLIGLTKDKKLKLISLSKYIKNTNKQEIITSKNNKKKIAIIYAEGDIITGKSKDKSMGAETISEAIQKAANDKTVRAIVFRVNSPGGSALASEVILHEIELAKAKKPIIVSMGKYAASGGYYISCLADKIYAEPYTLTGSIGVFGMYFNVQKLINNKLGVKVSVVKTNDYSDFGNIFRQMTPTERKYITFQIEDIYDQFITHVAAGRNLKKEFVDSIGQGRIWVADDALKLGLIDKIGGIDDAIAEAASEAKIDNYKIIEYPKVKNFMEKFMEQYQVNMMQQKLGYLYETYENIQQLQNMRGIQARFVYDIDID